MNLGPLRREIRSFRESAGVLQRGVVHGVVRSVQRQVLLVDSDRDVTEVFRKAFGTRFSLFTVAAAEPALAIVQATPPDVVILEYRLPDLSGLELMQRIKALRPSLPVIMLTAYGSEIVCATALKLGVRDYFIKPCAPGVLETSITRLIGAVSSQRTRRRNVLLPLYHQALQGHSSPSEAIKNPIVRAVELVSKLACEPLTLGALSSRVGVGRYALCRRFKSVAGLGFRRYLISCRLERAKKLLTDSRYSITTVAQMVGFGDLPHFDKAFRKYVGSSPSVFRMRAGVRGDNHAAIKY